MLTEPTPGLYGGRFCYSQKNARRLKNVPPCSKTAADIAENIKITFSNEGRSDTAARVYPSYEKRFAAFDVARSDGLKQPPIEAAVFYAIASVLTFPLLSDL